MPKGSFDGERLHYMEKKIPNLIPALVLLVLVVAVSAIFGYISFQEEDTTLQGQAEVTEYRVSSKVPGRIARILVEEGQYVHAGDTLALLDAPDVEAKLSQAQAAEAGAAAQSQKADKGARQEQITGAYEMWQKAKVGHEVMQKSFERVKNLYEQGVISAQKYDETKAQLDAAAATERAAKSQYDMAKNGAQAEDKEAARSLVNRAQGAVREVSSYIHEMVLIAAEDGEVTQIYPSVGELVGTGAPIMSIAKIQDLWITFNVREDYLKDFEMGQIFKARIPALDTEAEFKVFAMRDLGSYAAWKATKATGQFDMKTFEVKARPLSPIKNLRPGMSIIK